VKTCRKGLHQYEEGNKTCPECLRVALRTWRSSRSTPENKAKHAEYVRNWRHNNPEFRARRAAREQTPEYRAKKAEQARNRWANPEFRAKKAEQERFNKYDLTPEQWEQMFDAQGRRCANDLCKATEPGRGGGWPTDHCHKTKKVRGILCHNCNIALGHAKDCKRRLAGLIAYLEKHSLPENVLQFPKSDDLTTLLKASIVLHERKF
jgi:Recombination endonuclease VII